MYYTCKHCLKEQGQEIFLMLIKGANELEVTSEIFVWHM